MSAQVHAFFSLLAGLTALVPTPGRAREAPPADGWSTLDQARQAGAEVAVLCGADGVVARTPLQRVTLTPARADWCRVDAVGGVVWFGDTRRHEVHALDVHTHQVKRVVTGALDNFALYWRTTHPPRALMGPLGQETHWMGLEVDTQQIVVYGGNLAYTLPEGQLEKDQKRARIADPAFLVAIAARGAHAPVRPPSPCTPDTLAKGVRPTLADCEDPAFCGKLGSQLGATPLCSVVIRHSCGDTCSTLAAAYNTQTGAFDAVGGLFAAYDAAQDTVTEGRIADPEQAVFSPSGRLVAVGGAVFTRAGVRVYQGAGAGPGGFLAALPGAPADAPAAVYQQAMAALAACQEGEHLPTACAGPAYALLRRAAMGGDVDARYELGRRMFSDHFMDTAPNPRSAADHGAYVEALTWLALALQAHHPKADQVFPEDVTAALRTGKTPRPLEGPFESLPAAWVREAAAAALP